MGLRGPPLQIRSELHSRTKPAAAYPRLGWCHLRATSMVEVERGASIVAVQVRTGGFPAPGRGTRDRRRHGGPVDRTARGPTSEHPGRDGGIGTLLNRTTHRRRRFTRLPGRASRRRSPTAATGCCAPRDPSGQRLWRSGPRTKLVLPAGASLLRSAVYGMGHYHIGRPRRERSRLCGNRQPGR